ncbi:MAG: hypothetical protein NXI24_06710 [bacterium]|nr:hypothetical protein [bacterium]
MPADSPHNPTPEAAPQPSPDVHRASKTMAAVLARGRDRLNESFAFARHMHPRLDQAAFSSNFLEMGEALLERIQADGIIAAADQTDDASDPAVAAAVARVDEFIFTLFEQTALLCGKGFLAGRAGGARVPGFADRWLRLLVATADLCLENPRRHLAVTGNALLRMLRKPAIDAEAWLTDWIAFAREHARIDSPRTQSEDKSMDDASVALTADERFELAGFVIAWRSGLAELRYTALDSARKLARYSAAAGRAALGLGIELARDPEAKAKNETMAVIDRMADNPWRTPQDALREMQTPSKSEGSADSARANAPVLRRLGAFAGFDGLFLRPPEVVWSIEGPLCDDRESLYLLHVDAFGHAFRRVRLAEFDADDLDRADDHAGVSEPDQKYQPTLKLKDGVVILKSADGETRYDVPQLKEVTSWVDVDGHTLYATTATSHMIYVIGLPGVVRCSGDSRPASESAS